MAEMGIRAARDRSRFGDPERERYRQLFERLYDPIVGYFRNRGFALDEAQDLAQDTFVKAYDGWQSFRAEASEKTWIYRIAGNTLASELRRRNAEKRSAAEVSLSGDVEGGQTSLAELLADEDGPSAFDRMLGKQHRRIVEREIATLPEKMRQCLLLRARQGLTYGQIAVVMRLSAATVKVHLFQGRRRLKMALGKARAPLTPKAALEREYPENGRVAS